MRRNPNRKRRGNTLTEFALVSVFLVPLLMGTVNIGLSLGRSIQVTQVARDAGHMFARQVNFSAAPNKNIVVRLTEGLGMTQTGGKGVVLLSKVMKIGIVQCTAGGKAPPQVCPNMDAVVIIQRQTIGNLALRTSSTGTPAGGLIGTNGDITPANYVTAPSVVVPNAVVGSLGLLAGEVAYVAEAYFEAPEWSFPGYYPGTGMYSRSIF